MRVEIPLEISRLRRRAKASVSARPSPEKLSRHDRKLHWTALALHINEMVLAGEWDSYAEASRACRVSRARITNLMALLGPIDTRTSS